MKIVGVQFKSGIKTYDFDQNNLPIKLRDFVLVETSYGEEIGKVVYVDREAKETEETPQRGVKEILTDNQAERLEYLREKHANYLEVFRKKIIEHHLNMKPVDFEFSLDEQKITFYFTAEGRVDFRELVRSLSRILKITVILRQMGQRDEARLLTGFGPCGESICCENFLNKMENISMDMVRDQYEGNRNASKVSGMCGRLMCCLAFEDGATKNDKQTHRREK